MNRANKAARDRRIQEVAKLLVAGAERAEIIQYARDQGWSLSERTLQRYERAAYQQMARLAERDKQQLQGRHVIQRRGLYARAFRNGDLRTALQILKDEAELQGLYPPTKVAPTTPDGQRPYQPQITGPAIPLQERLARLIAAQANRGKAERRRIEQSTPIKVYQLPDTTFPLLVLQALTQMYASEQLQFATQFLYADRRRLKGGKLLHAVAVVSAYRFHIGSEAWRLFTCGINIDADVLVQQAGAAEMLGMLQQSVLSPAVEDVAGALAQAGAQVEEIPTAEDLARDWKRLLHHACRE